MSSGSAPSRPTFRTPPAAVAASVAASLIWIPQAFLLAGAVGGVAEAAQRGTELPAIAGAVAGFLLLAVLRAVLDAAAVPIAQRAASGEKRRIRGAIAATVARWSPLAADRPASGEVAALAADQADALDPYLVRYWPARIRVMTVPFAIAAAVASVSWAAGVILLLAFPFVPLFTSLIGAQARDRSREQLAEVGTFTGVLLDRLAGLTTIRLFGAVDRVAADIERAGDGIRLRTMSVLRLAFLSSAVIELFSAVAVALVAVYVGFSLLGWVGFGTTFGPMTLATGLFVLLLAPDFFQPLRDFAGAYHDKASADAFADRSAALIGQPRTTIVGEGLPAAGGPAPAIRADDVTVALGETVLVRGARFSIAPGEHVALWGPSGSGKSTLLAALAGLVPLAAGRIAFGAGDMPPGDGARALMAWVGQDPVMIAASLRANAALARPDADPDEIRRALDTAELSAVVARMPRDLLTPLGERGLGLSGGEARRLAIARAILADRPLILADEPTAGLDAETAEAVRAALSAAARGRTLVVATHDPLLAAAMDRIIPLQGDPGSPAA